jgi:uncharacterized protein (DUF2236 family)
VRLHRPLSDYVERELDAFLYGKEAGPELFLAPPGEPALVPLDGLSAEIYARPLTVYIGGIAAVILELAELRVRHGVWDHSVFPTDPVLRLRRTGLAAMVTFYAARSAALRMIDGINRRHAAVSGYTDQGVPYRADDPALLTWVQDTAAFGFIEAYSRYLRPLSDDDWAQALGEARPAALAYGVPEPASSKPELLLRIDGALADLEPSSILATFLQMMRKAPALPVPVRFLQPIAVRAAVSLLPPPVRQRLKLEAAGLRTGEAALLKLLSRSSSLLRLRNHPRQVAGERLSADVPVSSLSPSHSPRSSDGSSDR